MNYLERYLKGGHEEKEEVWRELQSLEGPALRREPYYSQAREVAKETMRRVRRNCEKIVARLQGLGYVFGTYPDGSTGYYTRGALVPPSEQTLSDLAELESEAGPLPLSLTAFWQEVGAVDLVGMHPAWPGGLDPLVVDEPAAAMSFIFDEETEDADKIRRFAALAPDDLHKDNVSGGDPYGLSLPEEAADFLLLYERHNLLFVPYLRLAILRYGGLPGLDGHKDIRSAVVPLDELTAGLESF